MVICEFCKCEFSSKTNLNSHQKSASFCLKLQNKELETNFNCDTCDKTFSQKVNLTRHKETCKQRYDSFKEKIEITNKNIEQDMIKDLQNKLSQEKIKNIEQIFIKDVINEILQEKIKNIEQQKTIKELEYENEMLKKDIEFKDIYMKEMNDLINDKEIEYQLLLNGNIDFKKLKFKYELLIQNLETKIKNRKCEHNKRKDICIECDGGSICEHKKRKVYCKECGGSGLCNTPLCEVRKNKKYDGYCMRCYIHTFPDKPVVRNYKIKERTVVEYILSVFPKESYTWIYDKTVADGCSSKRPDLLLDLGYMVVIIEIDENQHQSYDTSCENSRIMIISKDIGHRPLLMIRFNPDSYKNLNNEIVSSCWTINKLGICIINKTKEEEWKYRLNTLSKILEFYLNISNKIEKTVEVINLFFDYYN